MLSVQTPSMAGMDRLVGGGAGGLSAGGGVGGGGGGAPLVVVVTATAAGSGGKQRATAGRLDEKHQQELSLIMGHGGHGGHGGGGYPHSIRLADGEPLDSIHSLLHLRAPYQHSELTRSSVQPPPNKSVCDVPGHHQPVLLQASHLSSAHSQSSTALHLHHRQPHPQQQRSQNSNKRPHQHMSAPRPLYQTRPDPHQKSSGSTTALLQSSSSSSTSSMANDDASSTTSSNSSSTSSLGSSTGGCPRSHSVSARSTKSRSDSGGESSGQKKDTIWSAFRQNVFGRFATGQKTCESGAAAAGVTGSSADLDRQRHHKQSSASHHRRKQQMAVMVPVQNHKSVCQHQHRHQPACQTTPTACCQPNHARCVQQTSPAPSGVKTAPAPGGLNQQASGVVQSGDRPNQTVGEQEVVAGTSAIESRLTEDDNSSDDNCSNSMM